MSFSDILKPRKNKGYHEIRDKPDIQSLQVHFSSITDQTMENLSLGFTSLRSF